MITAQGFMLVGLTLLGVGVCLLLFLGLPPILYEQKCTRIVTNARRYARRRLRQGAWRAVVGWEASDEAAVRVWAGVSASCRRW